MFLENIISNSVSIRNTEENKNIAIQSFLKPTFSNMGGKIFILIEKKIIINY